jgi:hypothetical protein
MWMGKRVSRSIRIKISRKNFPPKPKDEDSADAGDEGKGLPPDGV